MKITSVNPYDRRLKDINLELVGYIVGTIKAELKDSYSRAMRWEALRLYINTHRYQIEINALTHKIYPPLKAESRSLLIAIRHSNLAGSIPAYYFAAVVWEGPDSEKAELLTSMGAIKSRDSLPVEKSPYAGLELEPPYSIGILMDRLMDTLTGNK